MNKRFQKRRGELTHGLSSEEAENLAEEAQSVASRFESGDFTSDELAQIGRLLEVNESNFDKVRGKPWFKKAWTIVTGERGRLVEQTVSNLGKVQVGVIKILGELLTDNVAIKEDILDVFDRLDTIETDSHQLKRLLYKFNEKHQKRYDSLKRELGKTRISARTSLLVTGSVFLIGAVFFWTPLVSGWQTTLWAGLCGIAGAVLLARAAYSFLERQSSGPIPVKGDMEERPSERISNNPGLKRAESFLEIDAASQGNTEERVFQVDLENSELRDHFTLSEEEQRLLFSLQNYLVRQDIKLSEGPENSKKGEWRKEWQTSIERSIEDDLVTDRERLFRGLQEVSNTDLSLPKLGTILFEVRAFEPYFPISEEGEEFVDEYDERVHLNSVQTLVKALDFNMWAVEQAHKKFETALEEIPPSKLFQKVFYGIAAAVLLAITGGALAPAIGGAIGAAFGLSGAAAVSSGLAFLGGGALAAGGLGMAGGTAVIIGGGAALGAGVGSKFVDLFGKDTKLMLRELAKLEAISRTYLIELPNPRRAVSAVINEVEITKKSLESKANSLSWSDAREVKESAKYCESLIDRLREFAAEQAVDDETRLI